MPRRNAGLFVCFEFESWQVFTKRDTKTDAKHVAAPSVENCAKISGFRYRNEQKWSRVLKTVPKRGQKGTDFGIYIVTRV